MASQSTKLMFQPLCGTQITSHTLKTDRSTEEDPCRHSHFNLKLLNIYGEITFTAKSIR